EEMGSASSSRDRPPIDRNLDDLEPGFSHEGAVNSKRSATFLVRAVMLLAPIPGCVVVPGVEIFDCRAVAEPIAGQVALKLGLRGVNRDHVEGSLVVITGSLRRVDLQQDEHETPLP